MSKAWTKLITGGGDFIWLNQRTMLAGRSYRTNAEGLRQLARIRAAEGASLKSVDLPHDRGPGTCCT